MRENVSVLDLAIAHHDALASVLGRHRSDDSEQVVRARGDFFLEALSAFYMVQSGFREVHEAATLERRHAEMLRRLSDFSPMPPLPSEPRVRSGRYCDSSLNRRAS